MSTGMQTPQSISRFRNYLYTRIVTRTVKVLGTGNQRFPMLQV